MVQRQTKMVQRQTNAQSIAEKVRAMAINLTKNEIGLLKELKAAGERGRQMRRDGNGLERLVKAHFVKVRPASAEAVVYFITPLGSYALERAD